MPAITQVNYPTGSLVIEIAPSGVAADPNLIIGVQSDMIDNTLTLDEDHHVSGIWTAGAGPIVPAQAQAWIIPCLADDLGQPGTVRWPDAFTGVAGPRAVTSGGILQGCGYLAGVMDLDVDADNITYPCKKFSVAALLGQKMPTRWVLFVTQNSQARAHATPALHAWWYQRVRGSVT